MREDNPATIRRRPGRQTGFTIMEVVLSLTLFLMMTLVFAAAFPIISSQAQASDNTAQAAMMVQHKMDQMRAAGFHTVGDPSGLLATGDVDSITTRTGATLYTADFTAVDGLAATNGPGSGYFPPNTMGTITVQDLSAVNPALGVPAGTVYEVTVAITWPAGGAGGAHGGACSTSTLISQQGGTAKI